jgi:hypothetical protein
VACQLRRFPIVSRSFGVPAVAAVALALWAGTGGCPQVPVPGGNANDNTSGANNNTNATANTNAGTNTNSGVNDNSTAQIFVGDAVVFGYNDLGMHCMNQDFSELMILPPFNVLHAQVVQRGEEPHILTSGITVSYVIPSNTHSADKTNFWDYAAALLGTSLAPDVGLTGNGLSGTMQPSGTNDWEVTGIPITPINDAGELDPYPLANITVERAGATIAATRAVVPVSWEMNCNLCHNTPGISTATDILRAHDRLHGTTLEQEKPVLCARCHADVALGQSGAAGVSNLSHAMHNAHAARMSTISLAEPCYACHPGVQTQCLRDVHYSAGMGCQSCHDSMEAVADPGRQPWVTLPRCGNCHSRAGFEFEQANTRYRDSKGHSGVHCEACHGSPHAITPTARTQDNLQAEGLQGHPGVIDTCAVCHRQRPDESFFHRVGEGD